MESKKQVPQEEEKSGRETVQKREANSTEKWERSTGMRVGRKASKEGAEGRQRQEKK